MTAQIRSVLQAAFQQGDAPQGSDYEDLIDSAANLAETTVQAFAGDIRAPKLIATTEVSAVLVNAQTLVVSSLSAASVNANAAAVSAYTGTIITINEIKTSTLNVTADTSVSHASRASASGFIRVIIQNSIAAWLPFYR